MFTLFNKSYHLSFYLADGVQQTTIMGKTITV